MFFQGNEKYNCATYLRLSRSDGDQQESNSIKNQRALLNDYMGKHPELHKFDEYVDDGYSGTNFERPDFKRMIRIEKEEQECADELDEEIRALAKQASEKTYIGGLTKECVDAFVSMVYLYDDQTMKIEFNCEDVIRRALEKYGA